MSKKKIVALGDSITKGVIFTQEREDRFNYSVCDSSFISQIANQLDAEEINLGKMGCTVVAGEQILDRNVARIAGSEYAFICFGGNDSDYNWQEIATDNTKTHKPKTSIEIFRETYIRIIEKLRAIDITPIILSLPPINAQRYFDFFTNKLSCEQSKNIIEWLNGSIHTITAGHKLYNETIKSIANNTQTRIIDITEFLENRQDWLCMDGIHPNSVAHRKIAEHICTSLC